ncbi:MAG: sugar transferase, partial [Deltaproteobacteria bacterium]|nr:sugar transferase [Deltaproteobacteria bacterium]
LFRQHRFGRNGKMFQVVKFRSMVRKLDKVEVQAVRDDPRITLVGKVLRKTALDELPQLWNILVGDMSFVGPRSQPEKERVKVGNVEKDVYIREVPGFEMRQLVRPGLTGITQIYAPREVPHRHKFKYDLIYIKRVLRNARLHDDSMSANGAGRKIGAQRKALLGDIRMFFFDLKLVLQSVWITLRGKWEV